MGMTIPPPGGGQTPFGSQNTGNTDPEALKKKWKSMLQKGMSDGGPVTPIKTTADRSGATGSNDYYSALGYDA